MSLSQRMRHVLVDAPDSVGARARARRWELTRSLFPGLEEMVVVDLGGTVDSWLRAPIRPRHVTVLNLTEPGISEVDWITPVTGDACAAVEVLEAATGVSSYDLVFSNSVLEHVGGHHQRQRLADSVRALAPRHWVQTPYRYFPLEPHWLFPGMQFLPVKAQISLARHWPLAHTKATNDADARDAVLWTELVGLAEFRHYFPTSQIHVERAAGLIKSLIAVQAAPTAPRQDR